MGWFDEQIKQRKKADEDMFEEAFAGIADAVLGSKMSAAFSTDESKAQDAIEEILKFYRVKPRELPDTIKGLNDRLEFLLRPHGIMRRNVNLEKGWYKDGIGAVLGTRKDDGSVVAFIPKGLSGYVYFDTPTGKWVRLTKKTETLFEDEGICFYKPFPLKKLTVATLMRYIIDTLSTADFILVILATLAGSAVGLLSPKLNNLLMGTVVESENMRLLIGITIFIISVTVSSLMIGSVKTLIMTRINTKMELSVQAATMMRIMSLPADFFKQYSAGELSDDELDNVAGGGCHAGDGRLVVTASYGCNNWVCTCGGTSTTREFIGHNVKYVCSSCRRNTKCCQNCKHMSYERGLWLCNHPANKG